MPRSLNLALVNMYGNAEFSGGVPRAVLSRAEYLVSRGHKVTLFFQGPKEMPRFFKIGEVQVRTLPLDRYTGKLASYNHFLFTSWLLSREVRKHHKLQPFDLIDLHDGSLYFGFSDWTRRKKVATSFTIHSSSMVNPEPRTKRIGSYNIHHELFTARGVSLLLPVSKFIFSPFEERGLGSKGRVVYNCVPQDAYEAGASKVVRKSFDGPVRMIFAARYAHVKGFDTLVEALLQVPRPERFLVTTYGHGPYEAQYRELVREKGLEGSLQVNPQIDDRSVLLSKMTDSDCFVLPTRYEAFSVALLEARGCGLATLSTNIAPNLELDPASTLLHDPGDAAGLAGLMERVAEEPAILEREYHRGRRLVEDFTSDKTYPALEEAYLSVL